MNKRDEKKLNAWVDAMVAAMPPTKYGEHPGIEEEGQEYRVGDTLVFWDALRGNSVPAYDCVFPLVTLNEAGALQPRRSSNARILCTPIHPRERIDVDAAIALHREEFGASPAQVVVVSTGDHFNVFTSSRA